MDTKSGSKTGSKSNLNESTLPLLEEKEGKKEEKIEMEEKDKKVEDKKQAEADKKAAKEKKKQEKKEKKAKEGKIGAGARTIACTQNFTVGLNVLDRDEKRINDHVNVLFEDVLGEPDPTHGFEFVWRLTYLLFNATRFWCYRILAAFLAIPFALLWAVVFAFLNIGTVWCFTPSLRIFDIVIHHLHRVWSGLVRCVLDPFFNSAGLLFGNMRTRNENAVIASP